MKHTMGAVLLRQHGDEVGLVDGDGVGSGVHHMLQLRSRHALLAILSMCRLGRLVQLQKVL